MERERVIIVGSGLAGLTAAYVLAQRGLKPLVLEAQPRCGGRLQTSGHTTVQLDGKTWSFPDEHGVHGLWGQYRNLRALLRALGIERSLIDAQGQAWIHGEGSAVRAFEVGRFLRRSIIPAPFHYASLLFQPRFLPLLSPFDILRLPMALGSLITVGSLDPARDASLLEGKSLSLLLDSWPKALRDLFGSLARNGLSADPHDVPLSGFIAWLRFYSLQRRDSWGFSFLRDGAGSRLVDPLSTAAVEAGARIITASPVDMLRQTVSGWEVHRTCHASESDGEEATSTFAAEHVVLAVDAPAARSLLTTSESSTGERARQMTWPDGQPTVVIREWFRTLPSLLAEAGVFSGDFAADNFFWLQNIHDGAFLWHRATGGSVVEVHVYGPPSLIERSDDELEEMVIRDLERAFSGVAGQRIQGMVRRNPPTHTLYRVGMGERSLAVESPWPCMWCCGDWIRHPSPSLFMERACTTGLAAANRVLASERLEAWPTLDPLPPEPLASLFQALVGVFRRDKA